jgi:hypothetical protein
MPNRRTLVVPGFGISRSRTGSGLNCWVLRSTRSSASQREASAPMARGRTPSTPAERAPRFARTRSHATSSVHGWWTRLYRSSNRRSGASVAHWCSLACIRSTHTRAASSVGAGASVFTDDLLPLQHVGCALAGSLRPVVGFPDLRLLRTLRPILANTADDAPARLHNYRVQLRA